MIAMVKPFLGSNRVCCVAYLACVEREQTRAKFDVFLLRESGSE